MDFINVPLGRRYLRSSLVRKPVSCIYPISGQYDLLARWFFYAALLFSFIVRRHAGLAIAALGSAMLYAATTALHAIALLLTYKWSSPRFDNQYSARAFGDVDIYPITAVLSTSTVMLAPILNWSISVRRHRAQFIIVAWGVLILAALIPVFLFIHWPGTKRFRVWYLDELLSFALCQNLEGCDNASTFLTYTRYRKCRCVDFCGTFSPEAPMRSGQQMVPFLGLYENEQSYISIGNFYEVAEYGAAVVILHGGLGILQSQFSHTEFRNIIFRILMMDKQTVRGITGIVIQQADGRERHKGKEMQYHSKSARARWWKNILMIWGCFRVLLAKVVAATFFSIAITISLFSPFFIVANVVANEYEASQYPQSEGSNAVGAWAVWISAAMAILTAIVLGCQRSCERLILSLIGLEEVTQSAPLSDLRALPEGSTTKRILKQVIAPFWHTYHTIHYLLVAGRLTFAEFGAWLRDPIARSYDTYQETRRQWEDRYPRCSCWYCVTLAHEPAKVSDQSRIEEEYHTLGIRVLKHLERKVHERRIRRSLHMASMPHDGVVASSTMSETTRAD